MKPLEKYLDGVDLSRRNYNHAKTSAQWADIFGEQNCRFRIFDRASFPQGDIRRDFLRTLPTPPDFDGMNARSLQRMSPWVGIRHGFISPLTRPYPIGDPVKMASTNSIADSRKPSMASPAWEGALPQVDRDAVRQRFADSNRRFLARWAPDRSDLRDNGSSAVLGRRHRGSAHRGNAGRFVDRTGV